MTAVRARWVVSAFVALGAFGGPARARASERSVAAEALFEQGRALVEAGRFHDACPKLAESLALDPGLGTMLWLADCYENDGRTASAWAHFKAAAAKAALAKDPREKVARERSLALERKVSRLEIVLAPDFDAGAGEVVVLRDGVRVGRAELGVGIPVDPGVHTVSATSAGRKPWSTKIGISPRPSSVAVIVPPLERDRAASEGQAPSAPSDGRVQRVSGLVVGGLGLAGIGLGTGFSFAAKSSYDDSNAGHCVANRCDETGLALRDDADRQALVATIAMGAGAAAVVGGALLYLTARRNEALTIAPQVAPSAGGVALHARF